MHEYKMQGYASWAQFTFLGLTPSSKMLSFHSSLLLPKSYEIGTVIQHDI